MAYDREKDDYRTTEFNYVAFAMAQIERDITKKDKGDFGVFSQKSPFVHRIGLELSLLMISGHPETKTSVHRRYELFSSGIPETKTFIFRRFTRLSDAVSKSKCARINLFRYFLCNKRSSLRQLYHSQAG